MERRPQRKPPRGRSWPTTVAARSSLKGGMAGSATATRCRPATTPFRLVTPNDLWARCVPLWGKPRLFRLRGHLASAHQNGVDNSREATGQP